MSEIYCMDCRACKYIDGKAWCACRAKDISDVDPKCDCFKRKKPTLFEHITASPEVLAAELVYHDEEHEIAFSVVIRGKEQRMGHECWRSTIIPGACWAEYDRAYAATVARLKEVCVEQNAVDYTQARLSKVDDTQKGVE